MTKKIKKSKRKKQIKEKKTEEKSQKEKKKIKEKKTEEKKSKKIMTKRKKLTFKKKRRQTYLKEKSSQSFGHFLELMMRYFDFNESAKIEMPCLVCMLLFF